MLKNFFKKGVLTADFCPFSKAMPSFGLIGLISAFSLTTATLQAEAVNAHDLPKSPQMTENQTIPAVTEFELAFLQKLAEIANTHTTRELALINKIAESTNTLTDRELLEACYPNGQINKANLPILRDALKEVHRSPYLSELDVKIKQWLIFNPKPLHQRNNSEYSRKSKEHVNGQSVMKPRVSRDFTAMNYDWQGFIQTVCEGLGDPMDPKANAYIHLRVEEEMQKFKAYVRDNFIDQTVEERFPDPFFRTAIMKAVFEATQTEYEKIDRGLINIDRFKSTPPSTDNLTAGMCYVVTHVDFHYLDKIQANRQGPKPEGECDLSGINALPSLTVLSLGHFDQYKVPSLDPNKLPKFRHLTIRGCQHLPSKFAAFPGLKHLNLGQVPFTNENVRTLNLFHHIEFLYLSGFKIKRLPTNLQMNGLKRLILHCHLYQPEVDPNLLLLDILQKMPHLEELRLYSPRFFSADFDELLGKEPKKEKKTDWHDLKIYELNRTTVETLTERLPNCQIGVRAKNGETPVSFPEMQCPKLQLLIVI